ncbi:hypothetical protein [Methyloversatilis discipulorum]|jgi:hypothetical protein|uniref:hypothetical protein n=1 Tax=Methyloversatilis discipulorum TaxID=1119528 RepID=UPI003F4150DF
MNADEEKADPPRKAPPRADRELSRRNRRTALLLLVLVLAALASVFYEFGAFGNRNPVRQETK